MADVQHSIVAAGVTPVAPATPHSLWISPADNQIWMIDTLGNPQAVLPVRPFLTSSVYVVGDMVLFDGDMWKCTTNHGPAAWNPTHFFKVTGQTGALTAAPDALLVVPADYASWLSGITNAVVRLIGRATAGDTLLHLGARAATQKWLQLASLAKVVVGTLEELANGALALTLRAQTGEAKLYVETTFADPYMVVGGGSEEREETSALTVIGDTAVNGDLTVSGDIIGAATAGEWFSPVLLGPEATPVYLWGDANGRLRYKPLVAPAGITDGTLI